MLTNHGQVLAYVAADPDARLRDVAESVGITERTAAQIVNDLGQAGYLTKTREGRRNRYQIQAHLPLPENISRERTIGEVLHLLGGPEPPATSKRNTVGRP